MLPGEEQAPGIRPRTSTTGLQLAAPSAAAAGQSGPGCSVAGASAARSGSPVYRRSDYRTQVKGGLRPESAQAPRSRPHSDDLSRHDVQVALVACGCHAAKHLEFDTVTEIGDHVPVPCGARTAELRFKKSIRPTMGVLSESFNTLGTPNERGDLATLRWRLLLSIPLGLLRRPLLTLCAFGSSEMLTTTNANNNAINARRTTNSLPVRSPASDSGFGGTVGGLVSRELRRLRPAARRAQRWTRRRVWVTVARHERRWIPDLPPAARTRQI